MPIPVAAPEMSRADARRNRAKVLSAARQAFAEHGMSVSLGEIARRAGVGAGTVYRHFPTKEILLEAVMSQRIERLVRLAEQHREAEDPGSAFFDFVTEVVLSARTSRDLCEILESEDGWPRAALSASGQRFGRALGTLLAAAQGTGTVRSDLDVESVQVLFTGCVAMQRLHPDPERLAPMVSMVIDSMRASGRGGVANSAMRSGIRDENAVAAKNRNGSTASACGVCGRPIATSGPGRPARFCSAACRQKAYRQRHRSGDQG